jgi:PAS domain S-box-containing protein
MQVIDLPIAAMLTNLDQGWEEANTSYYIADRDNRILYINPDLAKFLDISAEDAINRSSVDFGLTNEQASEIRKINQQAFRTAKVQSKEIKVCIKGRGYVIEHFSMPLITADGEVSAVLVLMFDRTNRARERQVMEALVRIDEVLRDTNDTKTMTSRIVRAVAGTIDEDGFALIINRSDEWLAHHSMDLTKEQSMELGKEAIRLAATAIDSSQIIKIDDATDDPRVKSEVASKYGIRSVIIIPLWVGDKANAALIFARLKVDPFDNHEVSMGEKIANSLAVAINDQIMQEELMSAAKEREALMATVTKEKELLDQILGASPVALAFFELDGLDYRLTRCNETFKARLRSSVSGPLEGKVMNDLGSSAQVAILQKMVVKAFKTGRTQVRHEHTSESSGAPSPIQLMVTPLSSNPPSFLIVGVDTTELMNARRQAEESAARAEAERARLRTMIDNLPVGIILVNEAGQVIESNQVRAEPQGSLLIVASEYKDLKKYRGRWSNTGLPIPKDEWPVMRALRKGETVRGEMIDMTSPDGRQRTDLVSAAPIKDDKGHRIGAVVIVQDITEQRRLEQDAIEAKEQAETYLDLITHDINCHNSTIMNYLQLAMAKDKQGKRRDEVQKALDAVTASTELIENVRKIQVVDMHDVTHSTLDLTTMLDDVINEVRAIGGEKVSITRVPSPECFIIASTMVRDVFWNILINSVKHSGENVNIIVRQNSCYDGGKEFHKIMFEDDGPGIPDEIKPQVFLRKYRGRTRTSGGGLGLYLCKRLVEEHGGKIWVEDRVTGDHGQGARFIVHLPAVAVIAEHEPQDNHV